MSLRGPLFVALLMVACGSESTDPIGGDAGPGQGNSDGGGQGVNSPACMACAATLETESASCSSTLDSCTNVVQDTEAHVACFTQEGACQNQALTKAASCHNACGDPEQANVETCTGGCFTDRAMCAERAIRKADSCLDGCSDNNCADLCKLSGQLDFDDCNAAAQSCADVCVRTYRGS